MRLEDMTPTHVRRAIALYLTTAWPGSGPILPPKLSVEDLETATTLEELFARFERPRHSAGLLLQRYTLRLGNARYPFMKFVVQEYLVDREYFFSVDTHDDLDVRPDNPDYEAWQELKRYNLELKRKIEFTWAREALPTNNDLRALVTGLAQVERGLCKPARLLIVDDEADVAHGLEALLSARGYVVEVAYDGRQVLDRLARDPLPDLILLDYSMPELDGAEVLQQLRANPRIQGIPVLLMSAASIEVERMPRCTAFLQKPYPREVLFTLVNRLVESREACAKPAT
jgi:CheY-like chemotaxis protein